MVSKKFERIRGIRPTDKHFKMRIKENKSLALFVEGKEREIMVHIMNLGDKFVISIEETTNYEKTKQLFEVQLDLEYDE